MRTVSDIIEACGGPEAIERAAGPRMDKPEKPRISHWAVRKWPAIGIPDRHWPLIIKLAKATPAELHAANTEARTPKTVAA